MKVIELPESHRPLILPVMPVTGWIINVQDIQNNYLNQHPMIIFPHKDPVVLDKKGCILTSEVGQDANRLALCFKENGRESSGLLVGENGKIVSNFDEAIQIPSYKAAAPGYPNFSALGFNRKNSDHNLYNLRETIIHAALGVSDGGIIIWRRADNQTVAMDLPCDNGQIRFSSDWLTLLVVHKNTLTIVDNPLI